LGGVMGLLAGILTIGFTLIAMGFFHGPHELMGYQGYGRERGRPGVMTQMGPSLWMPVDRWTNGFYDWLSVSTLYPGISGAPLMQYNPDLFKQASLLRDNVNEGEGQISMPADGVSSVELLQGQGGKMVAVRTLFTDTSMDFGRQLALASSQVRLVSTASDGKRPLVIHPMYWMQETAVNNDTSVSVPYPFDDRQNYATSVPGRKDADITFLFEMPDSFEPNYIQIRGTRFDLDPPKMLPGGDMAFAPYMQQGGEVDNRRFGEFLEPDNLFMPITRVPGFRPSRNRVPGSMSMIDGKFEDGFLRMPKSSPGATSRGLEVSGVYATPGTQIVYVDVSRYSPLFLGGKLSEETDATDEITLIDSLGSKYTPIGYAYFFGSEVELKLDPRDGVTTMPELPILSRSQEQQLLLIFQVTGGVKITSMRVGHKLLCTTDLEIPAR
ncbi:MAG: hypothetical protein MK095_08630, partial [Phycisphaerales bacterium]|nr:hypothetical protein [Phycisphaerales bacterium]